MTSEIAVLEQEIAAGKVALSENLDRLQDKAHALVDWRGRIVQHPWDAIGIALIAGGILGMRGRPRRVRAAPAVDRDDARDAADPTALDPRPAPRSIVLRALEALGTMASTHVLSSLRHPAQSDTGRVRVGATLASYLTHSEGDRHMTASTPKDRTLHDLFVAELKDTYDAENQLTKALKKLATAATNPELQDAFLEHLEETEGQIEMLDTVFTELSLKPNGKHCDGIAGIIKEGDAAMTEFVKSPALDAALVAGGRRAEHYEIAAYHSLIAIGMALGYTEACATLATILRQEEAADRKLMSLGIVLNRRAAAESPASV